jgi:23S rRNA pseudouridine1911/1915/1917 synthase
MFDQDLVLINGKPAKPSAKIQDGDEVSVEILEPTPSKLLPEALDITVIYQDPHLAVIDKPAGLITHPIPGMNSGTLVNALLHYCKDLSGVGGEIKPGIVHRLDKLTSGVMVAAKNDAAHQHLAAQFKAHTIDRRYLALVYGEMRQLSGTFESAIARNPKHRLRMTGQTGRGRRAVTHYRTLARVSGLSLVELRLETGRTHQIRVHLSENNHPLVGDPLYGKGREPSDRLETSLKSALRQLKRQALHAFRLGFVHPATEEFMAFESPLPPDIRAAVAALGIEKTLNLPETPRRVE